MYIWAFIQEEWDFIFYLPYPPQYPCFPPLEKICPHQEYCSRHISGVTYGFPWGGEGLAPPTMLRPCAEGEWEGISHFSSTCYMPAPRWCFIDTLSPDRSQMGASRLRGSPLLWRNQTRPDEGGNATTMTEYSQVSNGLELVGWGEQDGLESVVTPSGGGGWEQASKTQK